MEENICMNLKPRMVDLGLPSGTLWADRNVGAGKPEYYGDYFRFGEVAPFIKGSPEYKLEQFDKSINSTSFDAATAILGEKFCMPTYEQVQELRDQCYRIWTTLNNINGYLVTGPNKNTIFLPAAGIRYKTFSIPFELGIEGRYWSATPDNPYQFAYCMNFTSSGWWGDIERYNYGLTIRPVAKRE
jgi:hypothetical protein